MNKKQRTILITGATDGIGLALAQHYQASGARLVLVGRRPLSSLGSTLFTTYNYCQVDLSQSNCAIEISFWLHENNIDRLDLVVNNAAIGYVGSLAAQSSAAIRQMIAVNLLAPIRLTHALLPLVAAVAGKFVYISSVASALPGPNYAIYSATKAALDGFVRNLQIELMATRSLVTTQVIHPGATRTNIHAKSGVTHGQMNWDKFPTADSVAKQIMYAIERPNRSQTIGLGNQLVHYIGRTFPALFDSILLSSTRKSLLQPAVARVSSEHKPHCVITGAADGIGKSMALAFAADGYTITGIDIDRNKAEQTLMELQRYDTHATFVIANLALPVEIERLVAELALRPSIDLLIHNAGINAIGPFSESAIETQIQVIAINFTAPLLLTAALLQQGRLHPQDFMVFIASLSHFVSYPGAAVYAASKDGLASFARSLRIVNRANGGQVLAVYPGPTRTAHARRYSPDNRNEQRRMDPAQLAQQIRVAVQHRRSSLIPGLGNCLFALVGHWLPSLTERVMRRVIFDKLQGRQRSVNKSQ